MVGGVSSINVPTLSYTSGQYGKMALPVDSSWLIYSHFEHVSGIPAPDGTQGISINKLNLLDVLIGLVNQINKTPAAQTPANLNPTNGVDALIENMQNLIRQAQIASEAIPYSPSPNVDSGLLFSLFS